jgi:hypothetical protein
MLLVQIISSEMDHKWRILMGYIAGAPQIFIKTFFFFIRKTSPGSEKKNFILKILPAIAILIRNLMNYY